MSHTPYRLLYGKNCHLPVELENTDYWALKTSNFEPNELRANRLLQINDLEELRNESYTNSLIYKDKAKRWHDARLKGNEECEEGKKVLLYKLKTKTPSGKITHSLVRAFYNQACISIWGDELWSKDWSCIKVNRHMIKRYEEGMPKDEGLEEGLDLEKAAAT
ncbi:hypothetical protein Lser_V15G24381 [Lactuca serriola]